MKFLFFILLVTFIGYSFESYDAKLQTYSDDQMSLPNNFFKINQHVYFRAHIDTFNDSIVDLNMKSFKVRLWNASWITFVDYLQFYDSAAQVELLVGEDKNNLNINLVLKLNPIIFPVPEETNKEVNFTLRMDIIYENRTREKKDLSIKIIISNKLNSTESTTSKLTSNQFITSGSTTNKLTSGQFQTTGSTTNKLTTGQVQTTGSTTNKLTTGQFLTTGSTTNKLTTGSIPTELTTDSHEELTTGSLLNSTTDILTSELTTEFINGSSTELTTDILPTELTTAETTNDFTTPTVSSSTKRSLGALLIFISILLV